MASLAISMSHLLWRATTSTSTSAVRLTPIRNLSIVRKSSTAFLGVPFHATRVSPATRSSAIGVRHDSFIAKKLQIEKKDNFLGLDGQYFNHEKKLQLLSMRLDTETPKLTLILGPPNSGKTALVRKVVNSTPNISPVFIDLREGTFDNVENTITSFRDQFDIYFDHLGKALRNIEDSELNVPKVMYEGASISLDPTSPSKAQFVSLLHEINSRLPFHNTFKGYDVPRLVLIIDEANRFKSLVQTEEGKATIETFIEWLVVNTKQSLRFHVVLTSSDSFFLHWLQKKVTLFETMVVGDLTKSEAEGFFHDHILRMPQYESVKQELSNKFDQVFDMTGGRILHIVYHVDHYRISKMLGEDFQENQYGVFLNAYGHLLNAMYPTHSTQLYPEKELMKFSTEQLIDLMKLFVESSDGFITLGAAIGKFGAETVMSFIECHIVHLRHSGQNLDVPGSPIEPILLPMSRPQLRAMQALLQNWKL